MRSIMNRGLAQRVTRDSKLVGYSLTKLGRELIKEDLYPSSKTAVILEESRPAKATNYAKILRNIGMIAKDVLTFSTRLNEINAERASLQERLKALDKEEKDICEMVGDGEMGVFLASFQKIK